MFVALGCQAEVTVNGQPIYFVHSCAREGGFRFSCWNHFKTYEGYQENLTSLTAAFFPDKLTLGDSEFALQADDTFLEVSDINFKLAIIQELMYNQCILGVAFDRGAFLATYSGTDGKDDTRVGLVKPALAYFEQLQIPLRLAQRITNLDIAPSDIIYKQLYRYWDEEVSCFQVTTITEADLEQLPNLQWVRWMTADIEPFKPLFDKREIILLPADDDEEFFGDK